MEHEESFRKAALAENVQVTLVRVRCAADLADIEGLVLPGGESGVMTLFLQRNGLDESVRDWLHGTYIYFIFKL